MSTSPSTSDISEVRARHVSVTADALTVDPVDGRTITVPVAWYPRLAHGTIAERSRWRLIGEGDGIHWPDLDEDISFRLLAFGFWLSALAQSPKPKAQSPEGPKAQSPKPKVLYIPP